VFDKNTKQPLVSERRSSSSAKISPSEPVSQCLFSRMKTLLGNMQHEDIEPLQVVKYEIGQRFAGHMDWFDVPKTTAASDESQARPFNRLATLFAYLEDDCVGGETYFPRIKGVSSLADRDKFIPTNTEKGLVVRPRKGNAVFWNNLHPNGTGDQRMLHGGATVTSGTKIGLNIFSVGYLDTPLMGGDHRLGGQAAT
jgi:prolyl 4-hydroxylase